MGMIDWKRTDTSTRGGAKQASPHRVRKDLNMAGKMELRETTIKPGERLGIMITDANGRATNMIVEIRSTPQPKESPNAFSVEVYEHTPERCVTGCEPIIDVLCVPPE